MLGFHSPIRCPRKASMTAVDPLNCGDTKLVPPQPLCSAGWPVGTADGLYSRYPDCGSASADRSGSARPEPPPLTAAGVWVTFQSVGSTKSVPGTTVWKAVGVRYCSPWKFVVPDTSRW